MPFDRHPAGFRALARIALPMVVSQTCDTIMIFTDRLFLSRLGPELMNASMGGGLTAYMLMSFFLGMTGYTNALVAQNLGAGRKEKAALVVTQAAIICLAAYPFLVMSRPLALSYFRWAGLPPSQLEPQAVYFGWMALGSIVSLLRNTLSGFFSGIGRTRIVMAASVAAMLSNVVFNYGFVFGRLGFPAWGIRGAAIGTMMGGFCGFALLAAAYFRRDIRLEFAVLRSFRWDGAVMRSLWRFGSSTGFEMLMVLVSFNTMVLLYHAHDPVTATAASIVINWDMVSFIPLIGVEIGVTSLVGRFMGARQADLAHQAVMSGVKLGALFSAVMLGLFLFAPHQLIDVFRPAGDQTLFNQAVPTALTMLRWASVYIMAEAMFVVMLGALRGAGDTLWAMGLSVGLHWLMVGTLWVILHPFGGTPIQGWISMVVLFMASCALVVQRYRSGRWRTMTVVEGPPAAVTLDPFHEPRDL